MRRLLIDAGLVLAVLFVTFTVIGVFGPNVFAIFAACITGAAFVLLTFALMVCELR